MKELVSVIIPTYGRPNLIERAIKSCIAQSYQNIEIIVVDDNDPNSRFRRLTEELISNYLKEERIRYIRRQINGGGAEARNTGIEEAQGEFISFLDDDDEYKPNFISNQVNVIKQNKVNVSVSNFERINDKRKLIEKRERKLIGLVSAKEAARYHLLNGIDYTSSFFFTKKILMQIKGFEKSLAGQESIVISKILMLNEPIYFNPAFEIIIHTHRGEQISFSEKRIIGIKKAHSYKRKLITVLSLKEKIKFLIGNNSFYLKEYLRIRKYSKCFAVLIKILFLTLILILINPISFIKYCREFFKK